MMTLKRLPLALALWLAGCAAVLSPCRSMAQNADTIVAGNITSTQTIQYNVNGQGTVGAAVQGTFTGTVVVEGTVDGINWASTTGVALATGVPLTSLTTPATMQINTAGLQAVRIRGNTVASGTVNVTMRGSSGGVAAVMLDNQTGLAPFPTGATPLGGSSGNVAAATASATLTAAATGKTASISAFKFTSSGATGASVVTCTVTGLAIGTQSYTLAVVAGASLGNQPLIVPFAPPQPASAINTNIVASCPSLGAGNTNATMNAEGYLQ